MAAIVKEGFLIMRLALVLWSLSPVFIVWAIRGSKLVSQQWLTGMALFAVVVPAVVFFSRYIRICNATLGGNLVILTVRRLTDRREHLLSYLFPLVLSFWSVDFTTVRELLAFGTVMLFTAIAFWHLQLIYVNLWFALLGYRSVQVEPKGGGGLSLRPIIVLTKNYRLREGEEIKALRLTNNLFIEKQ